MDFESRSIVGLVAHSFSPSTRQAEAVISFDSRTA